MDTRRIAGKLFLSIVGTVLIIASGIASAKTHFIHTDHLGTPLAMTDDQQNVTWQAEYTPVGEATVDPASTAELNLRFPGQYYDEETGLHYNYFRDYDPETGRYVQSDPIGLAGGLNTYAYALNNPLRYTDPSGAIVPALAARAGIGFVSGFFGGAVAGGDIRSAFIGGAIGAGAGLLPFLNAFTNPFVSSLAGQSAALFDKCGIKSIVPGLSLTAAGAAAFGGFIGREVAIAKLATKAERGFFGTSVGSLGGQGVISASEGSFIGAFEGAVLATELDECGCPP